MIGNVPLYRDARFAVVRGRVELLQALFKAGQSGLE
jgi:hypothetical protein